jgi:hypothetical protein
MGDEHIKGADDQLVSQPVFSAESSRVGISKYSTLTSATGGNNK